MLPDSTCCSLFHGGFCTGHGFLREPKDIRSYAALACIAIQANQNEMHGGQSVPNFDYAMAEGVRKTFRKSYYKALAQYFEVTHGMAREDARRAGGGREAERAGGAGDRSTANRWARRSTRWLPAHQAENGFEPIPEQDARRAHDYAMRTAWSDTNDATYQAMEALIHNLNTMNSRAGAQVPFSSINYGTDTSPEARMAIRNLLLATDAGLGDGETPIFPVQIFKVKEGVNFNPGDPNYDLFRLAINDFRQAAVPELQLPGRAVQPAVLQAGRLQHRGGLHGLPHPRDGQRL